MEGGGNMQAHVKDILLEIGVGPGRLTKTC